MNIVCVYIYLFYLKLYAIINVCIYFQARTGDSLKADYGGSLDDWSDQNPSVFLITIVSSLGGEYQLTNGYGPDRAPAVMRVILSFQPTSFN